MINHKKENHIKVVVILEIKDKETKEVLIVITVIKVIKVMIEEIKTECLNKEDKASMMENLKECNVLIFF